jgi:hypothetical protein
MAQSILLQGLMEDLKNKNKQPKACITERATKPLTRD